MRDYGQAYISTSPFDNYQFIPDVYYYFMKAFASVRNKREKFFSQNFKNKSKIS